MIRRFFRDNGLSLVLLGMFLLSWAGQLVTGHRDHNQERRELGKPPLTIPQYICDGAFWQATGENWESEFLQMAMFVLLTVILFQKGSPESRDPDDLESDGLDADPLERRNDSNAPWPVRQGGIVLWVYSHSLSISFALLFFLSTAIHAKGGALTYSEAQVARGEPAVGMFGYLGTARFWFESFQNWQSEFLSLAAMVWLSVYFRERGSAESKPVAAPHDSHGE